MTNQYVKLQLNINKVIIYLINQKVEDTMNNKANIAIEKVK